MTGTQWPTNLDPNPPTDGKTEEGEEWKAVERADDVRNFCDISLSNENPNLMNSARLSKGMDTLSTQQPDLRSIGSGTSVFFLLHRYCRIVARRDKTKASVVRKAIAVS